jgi:hypothetical protein
LTPSPAGHYLPTLSSLAHSSQLLHVLLLAGVVRHLTLDLGITHGSTPAPQSSSAQA